METRYTVDPVRYRQMDTEQLREAFLVDNLFTPGKVALVYAEADRAVIGSAVPTVAPLELEAGPKELAADFFCQRRELGVLNLGGDGTVAVDGTNYAVPGRDMLYVGRGSREVSFTSDDPAAPARFYLVSYPAHVEYPTCLAPRAEANTLHLGSAAEANRRDLFQFIHEKGVKSCQLVMGYTELAEGSVWNTMPCHTHQRRSEVYLYFDLGDANAVFHMMGPGDQTRHLLVRNLQAIISPIWSIHAGCGTSNYSFVWAMGGENQRFDDMDPVPIPSLR